ncbi:hypothetical protein SEA_PERMAG_42 [Microbacterium phage PermaG]|nr:hypothetical protein SEA_PERMAG_42 [Microbacterium phage PermaG]
MNTTDAQVNALSEIDRKGQAVLDAIYAEEAHKSPHDAKIRETLKLHNGGEVSAKGVIDEIEKLTGMDLVATMRYALEDMRLAQERAQAVRDYTTVRRLLNQMGF